MLSQTFQEWSAPTEVLAKAGSRAELSNAWLAEAAGIDLDAAEDVEELARIGRGVRRVKISMSDKRQALMDLAKLRRMLPADRHDHSGSIEYLVRPEHKIDIEGMSPEEREQLRKILLTAVADKEI